MADYHLKYWIECLESSFDEHGIEATDEQIKSVAYDVQGAHENYGMAFYSPPASDRISAIEGEHDAKYKALQAEFDTYRANSETAIKQALRLFPDAQVSIHEHGEVLQHGGRTERVQ